MKCWVCGRTPEEVAKESTAGNNLEGEISPEDFNEMRDHDETREFYVCKVCKKVISCVAFNEAVDLDEIVVRTLREDGNFKPKITDNR